MFQTAILNNIIFKKKNNKKLPIITKLLSTNSTFLNQFIYF